MILHPISWYTHALKADLPPDLLAPDWSSLGWLPLHTGIIAVASVAIAGRWVPWPIVPVLSLVIGAGFAGLTFLGHELLHGGVVHGKRIQHIIGWICFLPFMLSPELWVAWHNRVHHPNANRTGVDPDAFPTIEEYRTSRHARWIVDYMSLGRGRLINAVALVLAFTFQCLQVLIFARKKNYLSPGKHRLAIAETVLGAVFWAAVGVAAGFVPFLFIYVLPLLVANVIVMSFIVTNHGLSPLTDVNDPLVNSLSVTLPRWLEPLTLRFGFHVEHHLFPSMSSRRAPEVRELVRAHWPDRYQSMSLMQALLALHRTARVYKTPSLLIDPRSGREWPTLLPRISEAGVLPPVTVG